ncbi:hypothetical protein BC567DRAFT_229025, partial [Phyllosticta citribraziliensis]
MLLHQIRTARKRCSSKAATHRSMRAAMVCPRHPRRPSSRPQHVQNVHRWDNESRVAISRSMLAIPRLSNSPTQTPAHILADTLTLSKRHNIEYKKHAPPARPSFQASSHGCVTSQPMSLTIPASPTRLAQPSKLQTNLSPSHQAQKQGLASELVASKTDARWQTSVLQALRLSVEWLVGSRWNTDAGSASAPERDWSCFQKRQHRVPKKRQCLRWNTGRRRRIGGDTS